MHTFSEGSMKVEIVHCSTRNFRIWSLMYSDLIAMTVLGFVLIISEICIVLRVIPLFRRYGIRKLISAPTFLNLHLSLILAVITPAFRVFRQFNIFPCSAPFGCGICGVISRTLLSTYPFTMTSIFYELTKPGRRKKGGWILLFFAPWTAAFSLSIPVYWTYSYIEGSNEHGNQTTVCARALFMGSRIAYLGYECTSVFFRYVVPSAYMFYVLHMVGFRLKFLFVCQRIPDHIPRNKIRHVRFVFFHMVYYLLTWTPMGVYNLVAVFGARLPTISCPIPLIPGKPEWLGFNVLFLFQIVFQPFLYFCTVYDVPFYDYIQGVRNGLVRIV